MHVVMAQAQPIALRRACLQAADSCAAAARAVDAIRRALAANIPPSNHKERGATQRDHAAALVHWRDAAPNGKAAAYAALTSAAARVEGLRRIDAERAAQLERLAYLEGKVGELSAAAAELRAAAAELREAAAAGGTRREWRLALGAIAAGELRERLPTGAREWAPKTRRGARPEWRGSVVPASVGLRSPPWGDALCAGADGRRWQDRSEYADRMSRKDT